MSIDSHCHLHDPRMAPVRAAALQRAREAGVQALLLAGVDPPGWTEAAVLAREHQGAPELWVSYGLHPQVVADGDDAATQAALAELAQIFRSPPLGVAAVALGEIGLDALTPERRAVLPRQEQALRAQLALARAQGVPVLLHILRTHGPALQLLRREGLPQAGGVVHSFSGSAELVPDYLKPGLHLSFAGPVTYHNASRVLAAARCVPRERLLVETDAPDQTPEPQRSTGDQAPQNEPAFLPAVIAALAAARGERPEELAAYTADNARRLFQRL